MRIPALFLYFRWDFSITLFFKMVHYFRECFGVCSLLECNGNNPNIIGPRRKQDLTHSFGECFFFAIPQKKTGLIFEWFHLRMNLTLQPGLQGLRLTSHFVSPVEKLVRQKCKATQLRVHQKTKPQILQPVAHRKQMNCQSSFVSIIISIASLSL